MGDILTGLTAGEQEILERYAFDVEAFRQNAAALAEGRLGPDSNVVRGPVEAPGPSDVIPWPKSRRILGDWTRMGEAALQRGEVGLVILNGGMATRFGGVVKGVVDVLPGKSFLALRLGDVAANPAPVQVFLLNSFATDADTRAHLEAHGSFGLPKDRLATLLQRISLRLDPKGGLFRGADDKASLYAPGHGDLFEVLHTSPAVSAWAKRGGKYLHVSNVDNLGATLSAQVIGAHIASQRQVTVEVAARAKGDKGGAPARWGGRVVVLEGFRFPAAFPIDSIPVFNTNTMVIDVTLAKPQPLTWFRVDKEVDGKPAVQMERLMGEVTSLVETNYLTVPREGPHGRFLPVKTPEDLEGLRPTIAARFKLAG